MLTYPGTLDLAAKPHQARLAQPPTAGVRDWRAEMAPADVAAFEAIAGDTLAAAGYDVSDARPPGAPARARLAWYETRSPPGARRARPSPARRSGPAATPGSTDV